MDLIHGRTNIFRTPRFRLGLLLLVVQGEGFRCSSSLLLLRLFLLTQHIEWTLALIVILRMSGNVRIEIRCLRYEWLLPTRVLLRLGEISFQCRIDTRRTRGKRSIDISRSDLP